MYSSAVDKLNYVRLVPGHIHHCIQNMPPGVYNKLYVRFAKNNKD